MKSDREVRLMRREWAKGLTQEVAAARKGMSAHTLRRYERRDKLPGNMRKPHTRRTREDPFEADRPWVMEQLEADSALQAKTLFEVRQQRRAECYRPRQPRTLQRRIAAWRCQHGPDPHARFEQVHAPGEAIQSNFTHATELG